MSIEQSAGGNGKHLFLHPSVSSWVGTEGLDAQQKVAAVAKVRCLEHRLFEGGRVRRELDREAAEDIMIEVNVLRHLLGWLEIDIEGHLRRNHLSVVGSSR